ncbi:hypothetical protein [Streptomyces sp. NPDC059010]|uniref:hypothetical protein n=1 Tax=Streptomyces sp. NPDC059010 TaxID=3346695 RepID=UPI0036B245AB
MGCLAFLLAVLAGTAETEYFGYLYEVLKPTEHRFATADQTLGTTCPPSNGPPAAAPALRSNTGMSGSDQP